MKGFTLIETMVAITLLTVAIVAPMMLTVQALASAYYSRDEITAYYLAQEAIEEVHQIVDGQILQIAKNSAGGDLFGSIPVNQNFTVDARQSNPNEAISVCPQNGCPPLQTDGNLYGQNQSGWTNTNFTRTVIACYVQSNGSCASTETDEMRISVTVSWITGSFATKSFTLSEDLYRWVQDGSGA